MSLVTEWNKLKPYFSLLDVGGAPSSRVAWVVRVCVITFASVLLWQRTGALAAPLLRAKRPVPIPSEEIEDYRFRLPERTRREIFVEIADAEQAARADAIRRNSWNGHLWSREDDRGHVERMFFRQLAHRYNISLTQVYLILDEGIRAHWTATDGAPLTGTTPALNPRSTW